MSRNAGAKDGGVAPSSSTNVDGSLEYSHNDAPYPIPDFTIDEINEMNLNRIRDGQDNDKNSKSASCASTDQLSSMVSSSRKSSPHSLLSFPDRKNIWSMMTRRRNMLKHGFDFDDEEQEHEQEELQSLDRFDTCKAFLNGYFFEIKHCVKTLCKYPYIYISSALVFAALAAVGLIVVAILCSRSRERDLHEARWEALESATWFSEMFAKSLIPLRSLQQAVVHSEYFKNLPHEIGNYGQPGSAQPIFGLKSTTVKDYRNVTGICDNQEMIDKFEEIVAGINENFDYDGIIVNYRLAPYGVFCVISPLINTKDFSEPSDNTAVIGWDPMASLSQRWGNVVRTVYLDSNSVDIFGPFVKTDYVELFCAHLAVPLPGYNLTVDGEGISTWGFVMHYIHWSRLKERSGIDERFKNKGYSYRLTRTDKMEDPETGMIIDHDVTIAENHDDHHKDWYESSAAVTVMTPNGEWVMHVSKDCDYVQQFLFARIATVFGAFIISVMFALILLERQLHKLLLYKIMPKDAIQKLNKGQTVVERYKIVTIFFSDIVGFTSLAGEMSPIQVMKMLNELYLEFDNIAEKHGVYKVETIGDAYMVVGGAPNRIPAPEAAQKVTLFALELTEFVKNFRTSDGDRISIRAGIASGPVVAGVVGQAMPRYCFFGDTVNLASRMESNSKKMKIQCSDFTFRLLQDAPDFSFNIQRRVENGVLGINVKGKGMTQTWWIHSIKGLNSSSSRKLGVNPTPYSIPDSVMQSIALCKQDWNRIGLPDSSLVVATDDVKIMVNRITAILDHRLSISLAKRGNSQMDRVARTELRNYVNEISSMYKDVPFHNFEHAVHVTISMNKLIDTIVESVEGEKLGDGSISRNMWENSFLHFIVIFSCLIHDVEHTGRSNKILADNNHKVARRFSGPSAERNSIHVALDVLFRSKYNHLRKHIFPDIQAKFEFGRGIFWAILCTDIASPERLQNCKARFDVAHDVRESIEATAYVEEKCQHQYDPQLCPLFPFLTEVVESLRITEKDVADNPQELVICQEGLENCVAVEHLMQVSDVAHLMQSWEVFLKNNFRLYKELMVCHEAGLMPDPSTNWAVGQIGFLENYVIPLALRCEVIYGNDVSSLNLMRNAMTNMDRWGADGELITALFVASYENGEAESDVLKKCLSIGGQSHEQC